MDGISLESLLRQYISNSQNQLFTSMPGRIVKVVSLPEQRVDVQLLIDRVNPDGGSLKHPVVLSVPLVFPGSQSSQFSFPVVEGDIVLCVFSQRSIDRFKLGDNNNHQPSDLSKYSRKDACAIPGLFGFRHAVNDPAKRTLSHDTSDTVVTHNIGTANECEFRLKASGDVVINSPGNVTVNATTATVNAESTINGDLTVNGAASFNGSSVTHNGTNIGDDHTHSGVTSGSSSTGTPN